MHFLDPFPHHLSQYWTMVIYFPFFLFFIYFKTCVLFFISHWWTCMLMGFILCISLLDLDLSLHIHTQTHTHLWEETERWSIWSKEICEFRVKTFCFSALTQIINVQKILLVWSVQYFPPLLHVIFILTTQKKNT